ncbi:MAG TPA: cellulase family glycosylhydrolase, partial [Gemmatimonadales bacterium]|nr:cellulase family glycosylhydrolase [Gemmatimonadales bacterium]
LSDDDLAAIRRLGFTAVRLILDPRGFRNPVEPSLLDKQALRYLDRALNRLLAHDLAVILTPYSHGKYFIRDSASAAAFARFWEALAHHVRRFDADRVFLEVANEPPLAPEAWEPLQREILAAMRRGAPRHTLIASGASWSTIAGLVAIRPVPDSNVVYTFHVYDPWVFTHQGVPWGPEKPLAGLLPYPSDSTVCKPALGEVTDSIPLTDARDYCAGRWMRACSQACWIEPCDGDRCTAFHYSRESSGPTVPRRPRIDSGGPRREARARAAANRVGTVGVGGLLWTPRSAQ